MRILGLLLPLLLILLQPASAADKALRIGTAANYPPLAFMADGAFQGVEADLAKAVGERLRVETRIVELPWEELIAALTDKRIDVIMAGMSVTAERSRQVLFTTPYLQVGQMALVRDDQLIRWSRPAALYDKGLRAGVIGGTTGEAYVQGELPDAVISAFTDIDEATAALRTGSIDIFIHDAPSIWRLTANTATQEAGLMGLYRPLTEEYLAWAVRPQDTKLADSLNAALQTLQSDGTLQQIIRKWIPVQVEVGK